LRIVCRPSTSSSRNASLCGLLPLFGLPRARRDAIGDGQVLSFNFDTIARAKTSLEREIDAHEGKRALRFEMHAGNTMK
jgi:hypothetical protein